MDSSTGMGYLQNQIQHKALGYRIVKTVSLCRLRIRCKLYFKLQKVEQVDGNSSFRSVK